MTKGPSHDLVNHATGVEQQIIEVVRRLQAAEQEDDPRRISALASELDTLQAELAATVEAMTRRAA